MFSIKDQDIYCNMIIYKDNNDDFLSQALSLIILELNYSKPHEGKRQNIQVQLVTITIIITIITTIIITITITTIIINEVKLSKRGS